MTNIHSKKHSVFTNCAIMSGIPLSILQEKDCFQSNMRAKLVDKENGTENVVCCQTTAEKEANQPSTADRKTLPNNRKNLRRL